ncbi:unnamed protein product, partial [Prorocentrum cordatum]
DGPGEAARRPAEASVVAAAVWAGWRLRALRLEAWAALASPGGMRRGGGSRPFVARTDFDKRVILSGFERRGWQRAGEEDEPQDWDLYWASVGTVRQIFNPETGVRLAEHQLINHFPNHYELTRKDLLARNIRRYRKEREKFQQPDEASGAAGAHAGPPGGGSGAGRAGAGGALEDDYLPPDWVPTTFALPTDYAIFVEEFRRNPNHVWIAKPTGKAQGRGIFLVSKLQQLRKWSGGSQKAAQSSGEQIPVFREPYIVSRYINDPLLVGGKKFDMRLYVLVTSFRPLKVYLYRAGFCRFCTEQYTSDVAEFDNVFVHLTNVAIQKTGEDYNDSHGGKWSVDDLMLYVEGTRGRAARDKLVSDMEAIIVHSLKAAQVIMINDKHCFEMYGFDILVDSSLKPWLLEVNASPSLSTTTAEDRILKLRLILDVLNLVVPPGRPPGSAVDDTQEVLGNFDLIYQERARGVASASRRSASAGWR